MSAEEYIFEDPIESYERSHDEIESDRQQDDALYNQELEEREETEEPANIPIPYIRVHHETQKASFFVTDEELGIKGFWCPHSAIVGKSPTSVKVASWCRIKYINYV